MVFSISTSFPTSEKSTMVKPVILPPGRATLAMIPCATGSFTSTNTTGIVEVARFIACAEVVLLATITSGLAATNSAAMSRVRSKLPPDHRMSTLTFRPSSQPSCRKLCKNASSRARPSGSVSLVAISTAMWRSVCCCARVTVGQATAALHSTRRNSRRCMPLPSSSRGHLLCQNHTLIGMETDFE